MFIKTSRDQYLATAAARFARADTKGRPIFDLFNTSGARVGQAKREDLPPVFLPMDGATRAVAKNFVNAACVVVARPVQGNPDRFDLYDHPDAISVTRPMAQVSRVAFQQYLKGVI